MEDKGRSCQLVKVWVVRRDRDGDISMDLFEERGQAVDYALSRTDWGDLSVYESIAVELDGELLRVFKSYDIDRIYGGSMPDTLDGVVNGDSISKEELEVIVES